MKYRHSYHAGNFADVHKHVTLLALLAALQRKDKGFLYLDTHAGRGVYDLSTPAAESAAGVGRFEQGEHRAPELRHYAATLRRVSRRARQCSLLCRLAAARGARAASPGSRGVH